MLEVIYVTRHGFSPPKHNVDPQTGIYHSTVPSPTGTASDPALASYGVDQARQLAQHLVAQRPPIERWYSSPWYRCVQTLHEAAALAAATPPQGAPETAQYAIRGELGLGEWFGTAPFTQPAPPPPHALQRHFPLYDATYAPHVRLPARGETLRQLHERAARAMHCIIADCDREGVRAIAVCTHAAVLYAVGRALTGVMPAEVGEEDFRPFCCGLTVFVRRAGAGAIEADASDGRQCVPGSGERGAGEMDGLDWRGGKGVQGGWDCIVNGDCSFLSGGEERGWRFAGDESFLPPPDAGSESENPEESVSGRTGEHGKGGTVSRGSRL